MSASVHLPVHPHTYRHRAHTYVTIGKERKGGLATVGSDGSDEVDGGQREKRCRGMAGVVASSKAGSTGK